MKTHGGRWVWMACLAWLGMPWAGAQEIPAGGSYPTSRLGVRTAPVLLLSRPDVRADLGMTAEQAAAAEQAITELYTQAFRLRGKTGPVVVEARRLIDTRQRQWIEQNLKPEQQLRLAEIELQWEGPGALASRSYLADELGLDEEQRARIREVMRSPSVAGSSAERVARGRAEAILGVLTPDQAARWRVLLGRPLAIQDERVQRVSGNQTKP